MEIRRNIKLFCIILFCILQFVSFGQQGYEGVFYVSNATTPFNRILPKGTIVVDRNTTNVWKIVTNSTTSVSQTITTTANKEAIGGSEALEYTAYVKYTDGLDPNINSDRVGQGDTIYVDTTNATRFNGDRTIRSGITGLSGINYGTDNISDLLNAMFFTTLPTQSLLLNGSTANIVREIGTTTAITIRTITTNTGGVTLGVGTVTGTSPLVTFVNPATVDTSFIISFRPLQTPAGYYTAHSYPLTVTRLYQYGSISSSTRYALGVYPYFYGSSATDYSGATGTTFYGPAGITKDVVVASSSVTYSFTASDEHFYFGYYYDNANDTLTAIVDENGFNSYTLFSRHPITVSSGIGGDHYINATFYLYKSIDKQTQTNFEVTFSK